MKAQDQLAFLIAVNRGFAGGEEADALAARLNKQAGDGLETASSGRRWRESKPRPKN